MVPVHIMDKKGDFIPILYGEWKTDVKLLTNTKQYIKTALKGKNNSHKSCRK